MVAQKASGLCSAAVAATLFLTACGGGAQPTAAPSKPTEAAKPAVAGAVPEGGRGCSPAQAATNSVAATRIEHRRDPIVTPTIALFSFGCMPRDVDISWSSGELRSLRPRA